MRTQRIEYRIGGRITVERLGLCVIVAVHAFGTLDVENGEGKWFRVTGLPVYEIAGGKVVGI